uniref:Uncharacterized protein n=1 Tax=Micrurus paraensis TaxID=1970185 RepID=A0A2D4K5C5_9SAUR
MGGKISKKVSHGYLCNVNIKLGRNYNDPLPIIFDAKPIRPMTPPTTKTESTPMQPETKTLTNPESKKKVKRSASGSSESSVDSVSNYTRSKTKTQWETIAPLKQVIMPGRIPRDNLKMFLCFSTYLLQPLIY